MSSLLPPSATSQERAIEAATAERIEAIPAPLRSLWDPATCPTPLLPWLAWALSVDDWRSDWPESARREMIAQSIAQHSIKGTVASVKRALVAAGYGGCAVSEGDSAVNVRRNGTIIRNGVYLRGGTGSGIWARYRIRMDRPITAEQAAQLRAMLRNIAPARCELAGLDYPVAVVLRNGTARRNGTYNRGSV